MKNDDLTQYEKTLLSQVNDNFDDIAAVGTARGGRSKLLGEIIKGLKNQTVNQTSELIEKKESSDEIERIERLSVENFRGFEPFNPLNLRVNIHSSWS